MSYDISTNPIFPKILDVLVHNHFTLLHTSAIMFQVSLWTAVISFICLVLLAIFTDQIKESVENNVFNISDIAAWILALSSAACIAITLFIFSICGSFLPNRADSLIREQARSSVLLEDISKCHEGCYFDINPRTNLVEDPDFKALNPHFIKNPVSLLDFRSWMKGEKSMQLISISVPDDSHIIGYFKLCDKADDNKEDSSIVQINLEDEDEWKFVHGLTNDVSGPGHPENISEENKRLFENSSHL